MHIERRYTKANESAYAGIEFRSTTSEIRNPDGSVVFKLEDVQVFDSEGTLLRTLPIPGNGEDIDIDAQGAVYAAGDMAGAPVVVKYGRDGNVLWTFPTDGTVDPEVFGYFHTVAVLPDGRIAWLKEGDCVASPCGTSPEGRVLILDAETGAKVESWGESGEQPGQLRQWRE